MKVNWQRFGRDLRKAREAANLSFREAAAALPGANYSTWAKAENGRAQHDVGRYLALCRWMGVDPFKYLRP